jgi:hypothetical protein
MDDGNRTRGMAMRTPKLSETGKHLLRHIAGMVACGRPVPFLVPTELDGTMLRTAGVLVKAGLVEWRSESGEDGTADGLFLTEVGAALVSTLEARS